MLDLTAFLPRFAPRNYPESLSKIAIVLLVETFLIQLILYWHTPLGRIPAHVLRFVPVDLLTAIFNPIPPQHIFQVLFAVAPAISMAAITHMIQFHDRLSDLLRIRSCFDRHCILYPLALLTGAAVDQKKLNAIAIHRDRLMRTVFYKYASSLAVAPLVDPHDIQQAHTAWSWYWALLEGQAFLLIASILAYLAGEAHLASFFLFAFLIYLLLSIVQINRLERYSLVQVAQIASDPTASNNIQATFGAL